MIQKSYILLLIAFAFLTSTGCRKPRRSNIQYQLPAYEDYPTRKYLPSNTQVTAFLRQGENKTYIYWSATNNSHISVTITTCASSVHWSISHSLNNLTFREITQMKITNDVDTLSIVSLEGIYFLTLMSEKDSYAHVFISTAVEFLTEIFQKSKVQDIKLKRRRRKRLTVRWETSILNPHATSYCLVVNNKKPYTTFCSAVGDVYNTSLSRLAKPESQVVRYVESRSAKEAELTSPAIICVGRKTHHTLSKLLQNQNYYIDVFATETQANLTYLLASGSVKVDNHVKPTPLKDGKMAFANLRKLDGKAVFAYKVGRNVNNSLEFYAIPCGDAIDIEIIFQNKVLKFKKITKGIGRIVIDEPSIGGRYYLSVLSISQYESTGISGLTVFATTKPWKIPFPKLPPVTVVHEYIPLRKCNSVTIGWYASPSKHETKYCLEVKRISVLGEYKFPNRCEKNYRVRSSSDVFYCKNLKPKRGNIITEEINLDPAKHYVVYVTVRKRRGIPLFYDPLEVYTNACQPSTINKTEARRKLQRKQL